MIEGEKLHGPDTKESIYDPQNINPSLFDIWPLIFLYYPRNAERGVQGMQEVLASQKMGKAGEEERGASSLLFED